MKRPIIALLALVVSALALGSCGEKEICYECTKGSGENMLVTRNCTDRTQIKIWKEEAENKGYNCKEK